MKMSPLKVLGVIIHDFAVEAATSSGCILNCSTFHVLPPQGLCSLPLLSLTVNYSGLKTLQPGLLVHPLVRLLLDLDLLYLDLLFLS